MALDDAVPGEAFGDAFTGAGEQLLDKFGLGGEALVGACEGLRIFFRDEDSRDAVHDDIGDATHVACDDGEAEFHGLDEYDAEAFGVALAVDDCREREDVSGPVFVRERFGRKLAGEDDFCRIRSCRLRSEFL